ncbi:MAG: CHAT domain-containing protein [Nostoc sp. DedQUE11]|nr:CHAT domain-containing protein [Nostoc sp. DedQUE11]
MRKLLVLKLDGDLEKGVRVTLRVEEEDNRPSTEITGYLPLNPNLATAIDQWRSTYRSLQNSTRIKAGKITYDTSIAEWISNCKKSDSELRKHLNQWLLSDSFRPIRDQCLLQFTPDDEMQLLIRTLNKTLLKLPWHLWDLVDNNSFVEVGLSAPDSQPTIKAKTPTLKTKVKILAILGNRSGINIQIDQQVLKNLPEAETTFLVEPQRKDINEYLWKQPWDILFFAGHSKTEDDKGHIYINKTESLTIEELKYALKNAVDNGLQLAIFNSCDGMGLMFELQQLHIPQVIVMREPVLDAVAQQFLTYFLPTFASGKSLYLAEREAREKLQGLENEFPCASWLPVIFQNPATAPMTWQELGRRPTNLCPYRGLLAFCESDALFFFGREAFTNILVESMEKPLVAVIGPSGSGKSSVVFAGLVERLRHCNWQIVSFRPGDRPLHALAAALILHTSPQMSQSDRLREIEKMADYLQQENDALRNIVDQIVREKGTRLLLIADEFEELYTSVQEPQERQLFLDRLLTATNNCQDFTFVITLRADFVGQALSYRPFADALQYADLKLGPMNREELKAAIEKPAALLGVTIEEGLTERILEAISCEPGNLPLLEFALHQLWAQQRDIELTHAAYDDIGGIEAALAVYAQKVYGKLNQVQKEQTRRIFLQLVRAGEGTEDTRRVATLMEVGEENWSLVTHLASERLLVTGRNESTGKETVEIVHEALIREWGSLRQWIEQDREFRTWQEGLRTLMRQWDRSGRDDSELLRAKRLADAEEWFQKRPNELIAEREYIQASLALQDREKKEQERLTRQRKKVFVVVSLAITSVFAVTFAVAWLLTENQRQKAEKSEISALNVSSEKLSIANQKFEALIYALRAGKKLQRAIWRDSTIYQQVVNTLQKAVNEIQEYNRLERHTDWVYGVSFSPDGTLIASASLDKTVRLWHLDGSMVGAAMQHDGKVFDVSFCPQGRMLATASADKTVKIWGLDGVSQLKTLKHNSAVLGISWSPNCQSLVTASAEGVRLWNMSNYKSTKIQKGAVNSVSFSPNAQMIAIATDDDAKLLRLNGSIIQRFKGHTDKVNSVSFSPDGKTIATASFDKTVKLWNLDASLRTTLQGHTDRVFDVSFSQDGNTISTASWDGTIKLWNLDGTLRTTLNGPGGRFSSISFSPKGKFLASGSTDKSIKVWQVDINTLPIQGHNKAIRSVAFNPKDNSMFATASEDKTAKIWKDGMFKSALKHEAEVYGVSFSPNGKMLATASGDKTVKLWNSDGSLRKILKGHQKLVFYPTFSPDSKTIATASGDKTVKFWNLNGQEILRPLVGHTDNVVDVKFSPDGKMIATASDDGTAKIWLLNSTLCTTLLGHTSEVNGVAFSPDGKMIATASDDGKIGILKIDSNLCKTRPKYLTLHPGHQERVISVKFSPDSQLIASASFDNTVKIWDKSGKLLHTLQGHKDWVWSADFSPDGKKLVSVANTKDLTIRLWNLDKIKTQTSDLNNLLKETCRYVSDYLKNNNNLSNEDKHLCDR